MSQFVSYLHEVFENFGAIRTRKMFGGYGVYHGGLMFGLVADDELYLKVDKESEAEFNDLGLTPFEYQKNGKAFKMSYYLAPEGIYDDPDQANYWAELAYDAACRGQRKKRG